MQTRSLSFVLLALTIGCGGVLPPEEQPPSDYPEAPPWETPYVLSWTEELPGGPPEPTFVHQYFKPGKGARDGVVQWSDGYEITATEFCDELCPVEMRLTIPSLEIGIQSEGAEAVGERLDGRWFGSATGNGKISVEVVGRNSDEIWGTFEADLCHDETASWGEVCLFITEGRFRIHPSDIEVGCEKSAC